MSTAEQRSTAIQSLNQGELDAKVRLTRAEIINDATIRVLIAKGQHIIEDGVEYVTTQAVPTSLEHFKIVPGSGIDEVRLPSNLANPADFTDGQYINTNGTYAASTSYQTSGLIPVEAGKTYYIKYDPAVGATTARRNCYFAADGTTVVPGGENDSHSQFTVPAGAFYVIESFQSPTSSTPAQANQCGLFEDGNATFKVFGIGDEVTLEVKNSLSKKSTGNDNELMTRKEVSDMDQTPSVEEVVLPANLADPDNFTDDQYINTTGSYTASTQYQTSGLIPVEAGKTYYVKYDPITGATSCRRSCYFAEDGTTVVPGGESDWHTQFTAPAGAFFVIESFNSPTYSGEAKANAEQCGIFEDENAEFSSYADGGKHAIRVKAGVIKSQQDDDLLTFGEMKAVSPGLNKASSKVIVAASESVSGTAANQQEVNSENKTEIETLKSSSLSAVEQVPLPTNLLDPAFVTVGYIDNSGNSGSYSGYNKSDFIPVSANEIFTGLVKSDEAEIEVFRYCCFFKVDKTTAVPSSHDTWFKSFTVPDDSEIAYAVLTFVSPTNTNPRPAGETGLFKSASPTWVDYGINSTFQVKYKSNVSVDKSDPNSLASMGDLPVIPDIPGVIETITLFNVDRFVLEGCSFTEGYGCMNGKAWASKLSEHINFNLSNFGMSGQRLVDMAYALKNNTKVTGDYGIKELNPKYISIGNVGNDANAGANYIDSTLYMEALKEVVLAIKEMGAIPVFHFDHRLGHTGTQNNLIENNILRMMKEFNAIGFTYASRAAKGMGTDYSGFWHGSHQGARTTAFSFSEWLYFMNQIQVGKSIKVFRVRDTGAAIADLNYDNTYQRSRVWKEIFVHQRGLVDDTLYDRLDESPSLTEVADEYNDLMKGTPVAFTNKALIDFTIHKVRPEVLTIKITGTSGMSFYVKDNSTNNLTGNRYNNGAFKISKAVYDSISGIVEGDEYTSPHSSQSFYYKGKFYEPAWGYFVCFDQLISDSSKTYAAAGTLTRVSGAGNATIAYDEMNYTLSEYRYEHISTVGLAEGSFELVSATYISGIYTITLNDIKYLSYDNIKVIASAAGAFSISGVQITITGGSDKMELTPVIEHKKLFSNVLFEGGFSDFTDWDNNGVEIEAIPAAYRDYPTVNSKLSHVNLLLDVENVAGKLSKSFTVAASREARKLIIRLNARLFPKIFDTTQTEDDYVTHTPQLSPESYDEDLICVGMQKTGEQLNVYKHVVNCGWQECYFELEIPPFITTFDVHIFRDQHPKNLNWPMQLFDVHISHE